MVFMKVICFLAKCGLLRSLKWSVIGARKREATFHICILFNTVYSPVRELSVQVVRRTDFVE
jgi:hypothetical protein